MAMASSSADAPIGRTAEFRKCQRLISIYIVALARTQDNMFNAYGKSDTDRHFFAEGFYDTSSLECHKRLCAQFAKCHENSVAPSIDELIEAWRAIVAVHGKALDTRSLANCVLLIKYIVGFCLLEARFYDALQCLCELLRLTRGGDFSAWLLLIMWAHRLEEWTVLGRILEAERLTRKSVISEGYLLVLDSVRMAHQLNTEPSATEQLRIADEMAAKLEELNADGKRTFMTMQARAILRAELSRAGRVPKADLQKLDDPLLHREQELAHHRGILNTRHPDYFRADRSSSIRQKVTEADEFMRLCASFAEYQETASTYIWELLDLGLIREAESTAMTFWRDNLAFGIPFWTLHPLALLFHIKSMTGVEPLDGYAKCLNALLTPPTASRSRYLHTPKKPIRQSSYRRGSAVDDSFERNLLTSTMDTSGSLDALLALELSSVNLHQEDEEERNRQFHRDEHVSGCTCAFCSCASHNWMFAQELLWVGSLLFSRHLPDHFGRFRQQMSALRNEKINPQRLLLLRSIFLWEEFGGENSKMPMEPTPKRKRGRPAKKAATTPIKEDNNSSEKENQTTDEADGLALMEAEKHQLPLHHCALLVRASNRVLLTRWEELGTGEERKRHIREVNEFTKRSLLIFRAYWLLLKHFARLCCTSSPGTMDLLMSAYEDQKNYGHMLFPEWRRRNCHFLVRCFGTQKLSHWHRALYQLEATTPSLRQLARMNAARRRRNATTTNTGASTMNVSSQASQVVDPFIFNSSEQLRAAISRIPENLTLVNLALEEDGQLVLTRCHCSHEPIVIPLCRIEKDDEVLERMRTLLLASDESVKEPSKDSKQFWARRKQLDAEMKDFVQLFQARWFQASAPLLLPLPTLDDQSVELKRLERVLVAELGMAKPSAMTLTRLLDLMDTEDEWLALGNLLYENDRTEKPTPQKLGQLLRQYWKRMCGTKLTEDRDQKRMDTKKYTLLVVPPPLSHLPWECLPIYQRAPLVSRIPCFHLFQHLYTRIKNIPKPVDGRNSYYVLNPGGDLDKTQERLSAFMQRFQWRGVVGEIPTKEQIRAVLADHDLFLYMGHGSGGRYFGRSYIRESDCRAVSVLMGCSSVRIIDEGPGFDGRSSVYEYLIARAPCVIGCLWMVTDGEIDRFFMALTEYCFAELIKRQAEGSGELPSAEGQQSTDTFRLLVEGLVEARRKCKLPYLTGAAVVAYGLPVAAAAVATHLAK